MPKHRGHGEGSLFKRTSASGRISWHAELMTGYDDTGRRKIWRSPSCKSQREAKAHLAEALQRQKDGSLAAGPQLSLRTFLARWLKDVAKPRLTERTYIGYESAVRQHILPALGDRVLQKLGPAEIQKLYAEKLQALSPSTVRGVHAVLHAALETALRWDLIARNPADRVDPPKIVKRERPALAPEAARTLLAAVRGDPLEALYVLTLATGLRQGELLALRWSDMDLDGGAIALRRAITRIIGQPLKTKPTKSEKGRLVPLIPLAVDGLRRHRVRQNEQRLVAGPRWEDNDLVFAGGTGRAIDPRNLLPKSWYPLRDRLALAGMHFHDLRHSAASLMLAVGIPPKDVSSILGHANIGITVDLYSHIFPTMQRGALQKLDELLRG